MIVLSFHCHCQVEKIDSLEQLLPTVTDTAKVTLLNDLCRLYTRTEIEMAINYGQQALELSREIEYLPGQSVANGRLAIAFFYQGEVDKSIEYMRKRYGILEMLLSKELSSDETRKYKDDLAATYNNLGSIYLMNKANFEEATINYFKALEIYEDLGIEHKAADIYHNLGLLNQKKEESDSIILTYFEKALELYKSQLGQGGEEQYFAKKGLATVLQNTGSVYSRSRKFDQAYEYFQEALEIAKQIGNKSLISSNNFHIAELLYDQKDYALALEYCERAISLEKEIGAKSHLPTYYDTKARIFLEVGQFTQALEFGNMSFDLARDLDDLKSQRDASETLSQVYAALGNFQLAYQKRGLFIELKDSIFNEERDKKIYRMESKYQLEKERDKNKILEQEAQLTEERNKRQKALLMAGAVGFIFLIVFIIFVYRSYLNKRKANELLEQQNAQIEEQRDIIEQKNKDITASITYAERIQNALLPKMEDIQHAFPKSFVFFRPRDIVSGDFYWFTSAHDGRLVITAVDCTGHGVPGAFMSFIGSDWLDRIINTKKITDADEILYELDQGISSSLRQNESQNRDGMDMALCVVDPANKKIQFAGANNPLIYIQDNQLNVIKGSPNGIGGRYDLSSGKRAKKFEKHEIELKSKTSCYLFSDGFQDQFGGVKGKKFMRKNLYNLLYHISTKPMKEQEKIISETFDDWKKEFEQIDDVLIIGFEI